MLTDSRLTEADMRRRVAETLQRRSPRSPSCSARARRRALIQDVTDDVLGYGPIDRYLHRRTVTEVMVNGPDSVYVEERGKLDQDRHEFVDETHLRRIIDKIVSQVGRRIDEATPMVDARLPDGSRVNAVVHPLAIGGPFLTIRKFAADPYTVGDLINFGTLNAAGRALPRRLRPRPAERDRERRYRHR